MAAGAWFNAVVHDGECTSVSIGLNGVCIHADTSTLKSVEVLNEGFESERDSSLEAARSLLYIEVGECSRCNGTHVSGGYEIVRSVTAGEIFAGTWEKIRYCSIPPPQERDVLRVNCQMQHLGLVC